MSRLIKPVVVLVVCAVAVWLYLTNKNTQLEKQINQPIPKATIPARAAGHSMSGGDTLPDFSAPDISGNDFHVLARGDQNWLLLIYNPQCEKCVAGLPAWKKLYRSLQAGGSPLRVVALAVGDRAYVAQQARAEELPFPVVPFPDLQMVNSYGVTVVPMTVLVTGQGVVDKFWNRPLSEPDLPLVLRMLCPTCTLPQ